MDIIAADMTAHTLTLKGLPQERMVLLPQALLMTCCSLHLLACELQCNLSSTAGSGW